MSAPFRPPRPVLDPIRVVVVDNVTAVRCRISRWIDEDPALAVVAVHRDPWLAAADFPRVEPDVVLLDVAAARGRLAAAVRAIHAAESRPAVVITGALADAPALDSLAGQGLVGDGIAAVLVGRAQLTGSLMRPAQVRAHRADLLAALRAAGAGRRRSSGRSIPWPLEAAARAQPAA